MRCLSLSHHAVERYIQRVEPSASPLEARISLGRLLGHGRLRSTPRHWMRGDIDPAPGLSFIYCAERPEICALVRDDVVITIVTRALCSVRPRHLRIVHSEPLAPLKTPDEWRWDRCLEFDDELGSAA